MGKEQQHLDLAELSTLYDAQLQVIGEMERKIARLEQIAGELFEIAPACTSKTRLLKKYQQLKCVTPQEPLEGISGI